MNLSHRIILRGMAWAASGTVALGLVGGATSTTATASGAGGSATGGPTAPRWVNAWQGSPTAGGTFNHASCPADTGIRDQTVRNIVFLTAGGHQLRVRVSNAFGAQPLQVGATLSASSRRAPRPCPEPYGLCASQGVRQS